jgi:hypothetical protein
MNARSAKRAFRLAAAAARNADWRPARPAPWVMSLRPAGHWLHGLWHWWYARTIPHAAAIAASPHPA